MSRLFAKEIQFCNDRLIVPDQWSNFMLGYAGRDSRWFFMRAVLEYVYNAR